MECLRPRKTITSPEVLEEHVPHVDQHGLNKMVSTKGDEELVVSTVNQSCLASFIFLCLLNGMIYWTQLQQISVFASDIHEDS